MNPFKLLIKRIFNCSSLVALVWIFGGEQIFVFFSRTNQIAIGESIGWLTGIILSSAIILTIFSKSSIVLKPKSLFWLLFLIVSIFPSIFFSGKIIAGDQGALNKGLVIVLYVIAPSLWAIMFDKSNIPKKPFTIACIIMIVLGNYILLKYYAINTIAFLRIGVESQNSILISYAFSNFWVFLLSFVLLERRITLFSFFSLVAPLNVFLLSTRQSVVYITLVIFLLWFLWMLPFSIGKKPAISITLSKRRFKTLSLALFILLVFLISLQPVGLALGRSSTVKNSFETASARWSGFFQSGYTDEAREKLFREAAETWKEKPILGEFHYHGTPGSYAHHMLMDFLAQYGLLGCTAYLTLIFIALMKIVKSHKNHFLDISLALMFVALLFVGMTVTQFTTNPIFHFLLFYWVSHKPTPTKEQAF